MILSISVIILDKISMKNIVLQQKEELRYLTSQQYQLRKPIEDPPRLLTPS